MLILFKPLTIAISNSRRHGIFSVEVKIASVVPIHKGKPNKNEISNYRLVSLLNIFSKIFENVIKVQLLPGFKDCFFPLFLLTEKVAVNSK